MGFIRNFVVNLTSQRDRAGKLWPPGAATGIALVEPDGRNTAVIGRGDSFDVYHGKSDVFSFSVTPENAMRIAWYLIWWRVTTWFGLRRKIWEWAVLAHRPAAQNTNFLAAKFEIVQALPAYGVGDADRAMREMTRDLRRRAEQRVKVQTS